MKENSYDVFFANFSNYTRVRIISSLVDGALSVGEIVEKIGGEQSNVSHHLRQMVRCKVLNVKQDGKRRIYSLNEKTVKPMLELAEKHVLGNCSSCDGNCRNCGSG